MCSRFSTCSRHKFNFSAFSLPLTSLVFAGNSLRHSKNEPLFWSSTGRVINCVIRLLWFGLICVQISLTDFHTGADYQQWLEKLNPELVIVKFKLWIQQTFQLAHRCLTQSPSRGRRLFLQEHYVSLSFTKSRFKICPKLFDGRNQRSACFCWLQSISSRTDQR